MKIITSILILALTFLFSGCNAPREDIFYIRNFEQKKMSPETKKNIEEMLKDS